MRVHPRGLHVLGGIDLSVHVDQVLLSENVPQLRNRRSGGWEWLTDSEVAGPVHVSTNPNPPHDEHWELWAVNIFTFGVRVLDARDGANLFVAGGDEWAAGTGTSYRDSYGAEFSNTYPLGVDNQTGLVALVTDYPTRPTLQIRMDYPFQPVNATIDSLVDVSFRDRMLTFRGNGWKLLQWKDGIVTPTPIQAPYSGARCTKGRYVLGYKDGKGLVVYDVTTGMGLPLHPPGLPPDAYNQDFNGDLAQLDDGKILVATSTRAGERPEDVRTYLLDLVAHTVNGDPRTPIDVMAPDPVDPPDPPDPPQPVETPMPHLYLKTRNDLFINCDTRDGTRHLIAMPQKGGENTDGVFSVWEPKMVRGTKVGDQDSLVFFNLVNFPGNAIGLPTYDAVGVQAACPILSCTVFRNGRGDDHDWTFQTEPQFALTLRQDKGNGIYLDNFGAFPLSVQSFRMVDVKTGKAYTDPFR